MPMRKSSEEKLLDAVDDLVFSRGIESTPVDAILARAGVSAATLYRGYRSKEALVAASLARRHERWRQTWGSLIAAAPDAEGRLLAIFDAIDEFAARPDGARWCAFLGTAAEMSDPPPEIADAVTRDTDHMRQTLRELAAQLPCANPHHLAEQILVVVTGELAMRLRDRPLRKSTLGRGIAVTLIAVACDSS
ncbi:MULTISPECIES: TetR/AcrR family transcriptional regulator [Gordonia]|jgi:AcrR family transcriptional regulator|uniref:Putative transcriptional regulator n=1 Tax=Gordonia alkanivorans NBRC 16433 TaxID=1027371 RepID=F9VRW9_9ACTN|nr:MULTISPECIES: TetR/AcrR family transcriptional regulator [Gordonia]MDH3020523.1 TetR/AcrR family transcriptional regulator [Gordonia alkanivorans]MDH3049398.1 TetR/AcrR family transcriptional regulator [Gordonia alkanivorans]MDJ0007289.1 TetR/AcrR family transcriptional regulator [Gordonia alkanivorans]MDJ0027694.1 TetR/AcrR family transcriptional regulator [Gordonia alkanivorans]MDJ0098398.1 TetR/AcrR family transcriptional regulator [Gordonia alkanivorans]